MCSFPRTVWRLVDETGCQLLSKADKRSNTTQSASVVWYWILTGQECISCTRSVGHSKSYGLKLIFRMLPFVNSLYMWGVQFLGKEYYMVKNAFSNYWSRGANVTQKVIIAKFHLWWFYDRASVQYTLYVHPGFCLRTNSTVQQILYLIFCFHKVKQRHMFAFIMHHRVVYILAWAGFLLI